MQQKQITYQQLDEMVGIEVLYDSSQLKAIARENTTNKQKQEVTGEMPQVPVFFKQPTQEQLDQLANKGRSFNQKTDQHYLPYVVLLGLVKQEPNGSLIVVELDSQRLTQTVNWFARFPHLTCVSSYQQNWYKATLTKFLDSYKTQNHSSYFQILADLAYCIQKIQNPRLVAKIIEVFKEILIIEATKVIPAK